MALSLIIGQSAAQSWYLDPSFLGSALSAFVTAIGFFVTYRQILSAREAYETDKAWRRSDVMQATLDRIRDDDEIDLICRILDWRDGPAIVPARYRSIVKSDTINIDWGIFSRSIAAERAIDWKEPEPYLYRCVFDKLCYQINRMQCDPRITDDSESTQLTHIRSYNEFSFYCSLILNPKKPDGSLCTATQANMRGFINKYYGANVLSFIEQRCAARQ